MHYLFNFHSQKWSRLHLYRLITIKIQKAKRSVHHMTLFLLWVICHGTCFLFFIFSISKNCNQILHLLHLCLSFTFLTTLSYSCFFVQGSPNTRGRHGYGNKLHFNSRFPRCRKPKWPNLGRAAAEAAAPSQWSLVRRNTGIIQWEALPGEIQALIPLGIKGQGKEAYMWRYVEWMVHIHGGLPRE